MKKGISLTARVEDITSNLGRLDVKVENLTVTVGNLSKKVDGLTTRVEDLTVSVEDIIVFMRDNVATKSDLVELRAEMHRDFAKKTDLVLILKDYPTKNDMRDYFEPWAKQLREMQEESAIHMRLLHRLDDRMTKAEMALAQ